jgi:hypothetical protein
MFIAIKDAKTTYVGISNTDSLSDMSCNDMLLDDNQTMWKIAGHKGWYMACGRFYVEMDIIRYAKGLLADEITYQTLLSHTIPRLKSLLESRGIVKDRCWYNELYIVSKDKSYVIDGYFCLAEIEEVAISNGRSDIVRGCLEYNKELPAKLRMCEGFYSLEEMRGKRYFPAVLWDTATGKKEVWWSYQDALKKAQSTPSKSKKGGAKTVNNVAQSSAEING